MQNPVEFRGFTKGSGQRPIWQPSSPAQGLQGRYHSRGPAPARGQQDRRPPCRLPESGILGNALDHLVRLVVVRPRPSGGQRRPTRNWRPTSMGGSGAGVDGVRRTGLRHARFVSSTFPPRAQRVPRRAPFFDCCDFRIFEVEQLNRLDNRRRDDEAGEPLVVGGNGHEPGRILRRRRADRLLVGVHVIVPVVGVRARPQRRTSSSCPACRGAP